MVHIYGGGCRYSWVGVSGGSGCCGLWLKVVSGDRADQRLGYLSEFGPN